jgi:CO/xanthine dehydrogenase Mo-binding subunit
MMCDLPVQVRPLPPPAGAGGIAEQGIAARAAALCEQVIFHAQNRRGG